MNDVVIVHGFSVGCKAEFYRLSTFPILQGDGCEDVAEIDAPEQKVKQRIYLRICQ